MSSQLLSRPSQTSSLGSHGGGSGGPSVDGNGGVLATSTGIAAAGVRVTPGTGPVMTLLVPPAPDRPRSGGLGLRQACRPFRSATAAASLLLGAAGGGRPTHAAIFQRPVQSVPIRPGTGCADQRGEPTEHVAATHHAAAEWPPMRPHHAVEFMFACETAASCCAERNAQGDSCTVDLRHSSQGRFSRQSVSV